jgi:hypothetical protein
MHHSGKAEKYVKAEKFARSIISIARSEVKDNPNFVPRPEASIRKRRKFLDSVSLPALAPADMTLDGGWRCFVCSAMNKDAKINGNPYKPVQMDTCVVCGRRRGYVPAVDCLQPGYDFNSGELGVKDSINSGIRELLEDGQIPSSLTQIKLNGAGLGDKGACDLCELLRGNKKVRILRLWNNGIGDKGAKRIARMLLSNRGITELNLGNNRIRNAGARALSGMLRVNPKVAKISVLWNPMSVSERETIDTLLELSPEERTMGRSVDEESHEKRMIMQEIEREEKKEELYEDLLEKHEQHTRADEMQKSAEEDALKQFEIRHWGYWHRDSRVPAFIMFVGMNYYIAPHLSWGRALTGEEGRTSVDNAQAKTEGSWAIGPPSAEIELEEKLQSALGVDWDHALRGTAASPAVEFIVEQDPTDYVSGIVCDPETGVLNCCRSKKLKPHFLVITVKYTYTYKSDGSDGSPAGFERSVNVQQSCTPFGVEFLPFSECPPQMMKAVLSGYGLDLFLQNRYSPLQREMALMRIKRQAPVVQEWNIELGDIT